MTSRFRRAASATLLRAKRRTASAAIVFAHVVAAAAWAAPNQEWAWHAQATMVGQAHPAFSAAYSGPNSLDRDRESKETASFDLIAGLRPWSSAELFIDGLGWQGFGLSNATGVAGFPNGEAFRLGTQRPNARLARLFLRETIGLGDGQESAEEEAFALGGARDTSRLVLTLGKLSVKDIFDNNTYANDPRTQFLNWGLMANEAWDYPADSLGFTTGFAAELIRPGWAVRTGIFQLPRFSNGLPLDPHLRRVWGAVLEVERSYQLAQRHGAVRALVYRNRAYMGSYAAALAAPARPANIVATRADRSKAGFGLNVEQEVAANVGVFSRVGWSDGRNEAWAFADVDRSASLGVSVKGQAWRRAGDTVGVAVVANGLSAVHQRFLAPVEREFSSATGGCATARSRLPKCITRGRSRMGRRSHSTCRACGIPRSTATGARWPCLDYARMSSGRRPPRSR